MLSGDSLYWHEVILLYWNTVKIFFFKSVQKAEQQILCKYNLCVYVCL